MYMYTALGPKLGAHTAETHLGPQAGQLVPSARAAAVDRPVLGTAKHPGDPEKERIMCRPKGLPRPS